MTSGQVALNASTATLVVAAASANTVYIGKGTSPRNVQIFNPDGAIDIYLGKSDVSTSTGFKLLHGTSINLVLAGGDAVYAISASATPTVHYIESGT